MSKALSREAELVRVALFRTELRRFLARVEAATREAELTPQRYDLLLMVESAGKSGVRVTELCDLLQMKQTAVTELVKRAVASKLIERSHSPGDGRVRVLKLTAKGRRRLFEVFDALRDDRATLTERFEVLGVRFHAASE
ncbi:MAG: MarR family winged helix-turn-helix transcriptional regulator [Gaiellaceae bacterium]